MTCSSKAMQTRSRLAMLLLAGLLTWPALSNGQAQPPPQAIQSVAPAQARQTLDILEDDKRRAELITTLKTIAGVSAVAPVTPAAVPAVAPAPSNAKLPLQPDSLAAQLMSQVSAGLTTVGGQLVSSIRSVNDLPLLWRWIVGQAKDPDARAAAFDAAWKLVVTIGAGLVIEAGGRLVLVRLRRAVSHGAQTRPSTPPPPDDPAEPLDVEDGLAAAEAGESEKVERAHRFTGVLSAFRRLPYLVGRLLLDLFPLALFAVVISVLAGTWLGEPATTRGTIVLVVQCYIAARLILAVTALLVSPAGSQLRLFHISDWSAEFLSRWTRRVVIIAATGYGLAGVGLQFNMYLTAYDTLLKLFALVVHVCIVCAIIEAREPVAKRIRARHSATGPWAATLNRLSEIWHLVAIFYVIALWLVWAVELRNGYVRLVHFFVVTAAILTCSRLGAVVLLGGLDRARTAPGFTRRMPGFEARANAYYPIVRSVLLLVIGAATIVTLVEAWGFGFIGWFASNGLGGRTVSALLLIGISVFLAVLVWEGVNAAIDLHLVKLNETAQLARAGRLRTLLPMLRTALLATIILVVALMTLDELGVNIAPLLAGAGVIGIAVGFGSQKLVQDLITGLFLLLENAMQVGDVVTLGGLSGTVEALSIRTIRLRALDGSVHIIPFSAVTTVTNQTRDYGYAVLDVNVGLNEEPDRIVAVLKAAADAMRKEPRWQNIVLEPLDVMGIEKFVDMAWIMRVKMKTQPSSRWAVARELNRRFKAAFDDGGIESPFTSHRVLSTIPAPPATGENPA
jgi:small-conductance mechanosensitive channel